MRRCSHSHRGSPPSASFDWITRPAASAASPACSAAAATCYPWTPRILPVQLASLMETAWTEAPLLREPLRMAALRQVEAGQRACTRRSKPPWERRERMDGSRASKPPTPCQSRPWERTRSPGHECERRRGAAIASICLVRGLLTLPHTPASWSEAPALHCATSRSVIATCGTSRWATQVPPRLSPYRYRILGPRLASTLPASPAKRPRGDHLRQYSGFSRSGRDRHSDPRGAARCPALPAAPDPRSSAPSPRLTVLHSLSAPPPVSPFFTPTVSRAHSGFGPSLA